MMNKHLYVHVPFCDSICGYCDFAHTIVNRDLISKYLERIKEDLNDLPFSNFETIYIGGGTPSCLNSGELEYLLSMIYPLSKGVIEYTIEVNPESIDEHKLQIMKKYGVNRISMGVESSDDNLLRIMNRKYDFGLVREKVELIKSYGINNISVDLMYSLPFQTMDILRKTIDDILSLDVPHISIYSLTIEENTMFNRRGYDHLDEDTEADMYEYIEKRLLDYNHYEVSNYCRNDMYSRHNLGYWNYDDFIGLGPGASSKVNNHRYTYTKNVRNYMNKKDLLSEDIYLDKQDLEFENVMMSLRTICGLDLDLFYKRYGEDFRDVYKEAIEKNKEYLVFKDNHCICTNLEILNTILVDFL